MAAMRRTLIVCVTAFALVFAEGGLATAQESDAAGGAAADQGTVVEGQSGGLGIGMGAGWLAIGALIVTGLAISIASSDTSNAPSTTTGTTGTSVTD